MAGISRERLSRGLFILPTLFTVGNLFCGYLSLWCSIRGTFEIAAVLIIAAGILDGLDGRIARMTHSTSKFGEEYDSLADLVSFGVAPAVLAYSWGLADFHRLGWMASFLFVVCGSMRLARFNIQTHVADKRYFIGLPIPAAAGSVAAIVLATPERLVSRMWMGGLLGLTIVLSYLMISTIKYRSFKDLDLKRRRPGWILPAIALFFVLVALRPELALVSPRAGLRQLGTDREDRRALPPQGRAYRAFRVAGFFGTGVGVGAARSSRSRPPGPDAAYACTR